MKKHYQLLAVIFLLIGCFIAFLTKERDTKTAFVSKVDDWKEITKEDHINQLRYLDIDLHITPKK